MVKWIIWISSFQFFSTNWRLGLSAKTWQYYRYFMSVRFLVLSPWIEIWTLFFFMHHQVLFFLWKWLRRNFFDWANFFMFFIFLTFFFMALNNFWLFLLYVWSCFIKDSKTLFQWKWCWRNWLDEANPFFYIFLIFCLLRWTFLTFSIFLVSLSIICKAVFLNYNF